MSGPACLRKRSTLLQGQQQMTCPRGSPNHQGTTETLYVVSSTVYVICPGMPCQPLQQSPSLAELVEKEEDERVRLPNAGEHKNNCFLFAGPRVQSATGLAQVPTCRLEKHPGLRPRGWGERENRPWEGKGATGSFPPPPPPPRPARRPPPPRAAPPPPPPPPRTSPRPGGRAAAPPRAAWRAW